MTPHLAEQARVTVCERCFWNGANVVLRAAEPCHKCGSWAARTITIDTPPAPAPQGDAGEVAEALVDALPKHRVVRPLEWVVHIDAIAAALIAERAKVLRDAGEVEPK
jgi:hypothetical protein